MLLSLLLKLPLECGTPLKRPVECGTLSASSANDETLDSRRPGCFRLLSAASSLGGLEPSHLASGANSARALLEARLHGP